MVVPGTFECFGTLMCRVLKFRRLEGDPFNVCKYLGISNPGIAGEPGSLHPGGEPLPAAFGGAGGRTGTSLATTRRLGRRAPAGVVPFAFGGRDQPQLSGLWTASGGSHPGRKYRPDEGRAALRSGARRSPRFVRIALDQGGDSRARFAQLAAGQDCDDEGAKETVFQSAQYEAERPGAYSR